MKNRLDAQGKPICPVCELRIADDPDTYPFVGEQQVHRECWAKPLPYSPGGALRKSGLRRV